MLRGTKNGSFSRVTVITDPIMLRPYGAIRAAETAALLSVLATKVLIMTNQRSNSEKANAAARVIFSKTSSTADPAGAMLCYHSDGEEQRFMISRLTDCTIGRSTVNSIVLRDHLISREHALIRCAASGVCELTDLASSNGTRLNGAFVTAPVQLTDGDVIDVGQHKLSFAQATQAVGRIDQQIGVGAGFAPKSLITALAINIRGYHQLLQILGEQKLTALMEEVGGVATDVLDRRRAWSHRAQGSAVLAVWTHRDDWVAGHELLNIFDAIADIQTGLRPLQKRYHMLRPLTFGCGINTGHTLAELASEATAADLAAVCGAVQKAHWLELATHAQRCDVLLGRSGLECLSPQLPPDRRPGETSVSINGGGESERAHALQFDQLGGLSASIIQLTANAAGD